MHALFLSLLMACPLSLFSGEWLYNTSTGKQDANMYLYSESTGQLNNREKALITHVKKSIKLASQHSSSLTQDILQLEGMSITKNRCLLNNLLKLPKASYLEIGCWKGSTFISALYGNEDSVINAVAIDDWSEFGGPYMEFAANCSHYLQAGYQFYSKDCFKIDPKSIIKTPVNIYFYDGAHTVEAQNKAFTHYDSAFDNVFITVVDDWNHGHARNGTFSAFSQLGYKVLYETYLPANFNGDRELWWHGLYVAVIRKSNQ